MIEKSEIINQPDSGQFNERIYNIESPWNSQNWTWVKFTNEDSTEWCGQFRGLARQVVISKKHNIVLALTSDYLFQLDTLTGDIIEFEDQPQYQDLILIPNGDFLIADYYTIERISNKITEKEIIKSPIQMDTIKFKHWQNNKLEFTCNEFANWDRHLILEFDSETNKIEIKNG